MSILLALCEVHGSVISLPDGTYTDANGNVLEVTAQIQARAAEIEAAETSTHYKLDRAAAYPSIQEQLDMQYWDSVNGTTTWADAIAAVKAAHPKGEQP